jgi:hypothetical protein
MRPALIAIAALAAGPALAAPPTPLPGPVRADIAAMNSECRGYGGRPGSAPELIKSADLNGDGVLDHLIDQNVYNCEGAASAMGAGQSGAAIRVYAGAPGGGARLAYQGTVYGTKIVTTAGKARLWIDTAGFECGDRRRDVPFSDWKFCSRPLNWNPAKGAFVLAPLAEAKPIQ